MLVSEFITTIQRESSETQDDEGKTSLVLSWLQDAITEFGNSTDWRYFQKVSSIITIPNTRIYSLDIDKRDVRALIDANNTPIEYMVISRIKERYVNVFQTGSPRFWYFEDTVTDASDVSQDGAGIRIGLWPVPNTAASLTAFTIIDPSVLSLTSVLPVPRNIIPVLKHKVRFYFAIDDKDKDAAQIFNQLYENELARLQAKEHTVVDNVRVMAQTDIPQNRRRLAGFDPNHFHN